MLRLQEQQLPSKTQPQDLGAPGCLQGWLLPGEQVSLNPRWGFVHT